MTAQSRTEELLRKKGIGPKGSKCLTKSELEELKVLMGSSEISLTTRATMLTALLTLEATEDEEAFLDEIKSEPDRLPDKLRKFLPGEPSEGFLSLIKTIINKHDLSEQESIRGMEYFFDSSTPDYLKASFLEAERLKRETFTENKVFFESLWSKVKHKETDLPVLIHICDSYDGSNRSPNFSLFTAALLGAAGFPTIVTGIDEVAPKLGITSHHILQKAEKSPLIETEQAIDELNHIGWTYLDQQIFFPELYALKQMRKEMVKRPFLATFEKLLQPVRSRHKNFIVTGYTHTHYREELVKQLQAQQKCDQAIVLKGVEGSTHISMSRETVCVHYNGTEIRDMNTFPADYNLPAAESKTNKNITVDESYEEGLSALKGEDNFARKNILYLASVIAEKFSLMNNPHQELQQVLDSGMAMEKWTKKL